jgi:L-lysine 2,3-aminomutase
VTSYVADELIDWSAAPDDPIYRLVVPGGDMPREAGAGQAAGSLSPGRARRRPGEQVLPGVHRSYHDTVSVFAPPGPAGSFGTTCPGRDRPTSGPGPVMPAGDVPRLAGYLAAHPEVSVVEFAGADPLTMNTSALRHFIEPLLAAEHLVSVRLRTAALACWPYRFTAGSDADELLRLFDQVSAGDKTLALIADLSHPRELEPDPAREAVRRIRSTGAVIYADGTLAGTVNDAPGVWAALWRTQARLGMIPRTTALVPVTGPRTHFRVTLARAQQIFATAYANVSGLARTVRGPAMRDERGLVCIEGTVVADGRKVFVLRYLQARDPGLAGTPFFAAFSADAAWLTDLRPAPGTRFPRRLRYC